MYLYKIYIVVCIIHLYVVIIQIYCVIFVLTRVSQICVVDVRIAISSSAVNTRFLSHVTNAVAFHNQYPSFVLHVLLLFRFESCILIFCVVFFSMCVTLKFNIYKFLVMKGCDFDGQNQWVSPRQNGWAVHGEGDQRIPKYLQYQREAQNYARDVAINQRSEVIARS